MCNSCLVRNLNSYIYLLCSTFLPSYFNTVGKSLVLGFFWFFGFFGFFFYVLGFGFWFGVFLGFLSFLGVF